MRINMAGTPRSSARGHSRFSALRSGPRAGVFGSVTRNGSGVEAPSGNAPMAGGDDDKGEETT